MIENKIYQVSQEEMQIRKKELQKDNSIYIAEINGRDIQSIETYLDAMNELFKFPIPVRGGNGLRGLNGYLDWMTDLDWLNKEGYVLIINNFTFFLQNDAKLKKLLMEEFNKNILPFWQEDVKRVVVGGKPKSFLVYLVD